MYKKSSFAKTSNFIVGAAKSGTTSLWMYLKQHPYLLPQTSATKEPSFFCNLYGYHDFDAYLHLFAVGRKKRL